MKANPVIEKITPAFGSSIHVKKYNSKFRNKKPYWHIHPEIELVYVRGGSGKRHIGNQLSYFNDGDLIMLGSNLPHYGFTDSLTGNDTETIVQMPSDFPGRFFLELPEMASIKRLFDRAKRGVVFHGQTKVQIGHQLEGIVDMDPLDRILHLLKVLKQLANSEEYEVLNVERMSIEVSIQENDRINKVYGYVRENFKRNITLDEVSDQIGMTVPSFCRYFKKMSKKTFTQFVNEYRIVHSIKLLSEEKSNITDICFESGFTNFSHFNKTFKKITGKSPSLYRKDITTVLD
jgi:AraC-like DNA-binding protein